MHIKIIIEFINLLMNQIKIKNPSFKYKIINLLHLFYIFMIRFEFILLFHRDIF